MCYVLFASSYTGSLSTEIFSEISFWKWFEKNHKISYPEFIVSWLMLRHSFGCPTSPSQKQRLRRGQQSSLSINTLSMCASWKTKCCQVHCNCNHHVSVSLDLCAFEGFTVSVLTSLLALRPKKISVVASITLCTGQTNAIAYDAIYLARLVPASHLAL